MSKLFLNPHTWLMTSFIASRILETWLHCFLSIVTAEKSNASMISTPIMSLWKVLYIFKTNTSYVAGIGQDTGYRSKQNTR